jgi:crotonobetainyl-CoA:carnitine CoA-transferase CaiB-like acyl-CoA transferase
VPAGPINDLAQVFDDPQVQARGMTVEVEHPRRRRLELLASPIKLSATPPLLRRAPPLLGQHSDEILDELGVDAETRSAWRVNGLIG